MKKFGTKVNVTDLKNGCHFEVFDKEVVKCNLSLEKLKVCDLWLGMKLYELFFPDGTKKFFLENPLDVAVYRLENMDNAESWKIVGGELVYIKDGVEHEYMSDDD